MFERQNRRPTDGTTAPPIPGQGTVDTQGLGQLPSLDTLPNPTDPNQLPPATGISPPSVGATPSDSPLEVVIPEGLNPSVPPIEGTPSPLEVAPPEGWRPDVDAFSRGVDSIDETFCQNPSNSSSPYCGGRGAASSVGDYNARLVFTQTAQMDNADFSDMIESLASIDPNLGNVASEVRDILQREMEEFGPDSKEVSDLVDIFVMISPLDSATQDEAIKIISVAFDFYDYDGDTGKNPSSTSAIKV